MRTELDDLRKQVANRNLLAAKLQITQQEKERLETDLKRAENKLGELTLAHSDLEQLCQHLTERAATAENAHKTLLDESKAMQERAGELGTLQITVAELKRQLADAMDRSLQLTSELTESQASRERAESVLDDFKRTVLPQLDQGRTALEDMTAQRNFYKKKVDSLSVDYEKLVKANVGPPQQLVMSSSIAGAGAGATGSAAGGASNAYSHSPAMGPATPSNSAGMGSHSRSSSVHDLRAVASTTGGAIGGPFLYGATPTAEERQLYVKQIDELVQTNKTMEGALEAYRSAFEAQLRKAASKDNKDKDGQAVAAGMLAHSLSYTALEKQYTELRKLANSLSETIIDKDAAIEQSRRINQALAKRVKDLEARSALLEPLAAQQLHIQGNGEQLPPALSPLQFDPDDTSVYDRLALARKRSDSLSTTSGGVGGGSGTPRSVVGTSSGAGGVAPSPTSAGVVPSSRLVGISSADVAASGNRNGPLVMRTPTKP